MEFRTVCSLEQSNSEIRVEILSNYPTRTAVMVTVLLLSPDLDDPLADLLDDLPLESLEEQRGTRGAAGPEGALLSATNAAARKETGGFITGEKTTCQFAASLMDSCPRGSESYSHSTVFTV